jgi:F-type H+-transporting ATPase subunit b
MATETHGAEQAATGLPQLDVSTFPNLIFWLVLALIAIYLIVTRIAQPRIGGVLSERAGTITNDIAAAEELKLKAKQAEAAYNQALADARAEAQRIVAETRAEIQADLDAATAKADAEIAARAAESEKRIGEIREGAVAAVREVAADAAREIVAALGVQADDKAVTDAVSARMKG